MIDIVNVDGDDPVHLNVLYDLLSERTPEQSISHNVMPSFEGHRIFVRSSVPGSACEYRYRAWFLITHVNGFGHKRFVGSIYLSQQRELGLSIFKAYQRQGIGRKAAFTVMNMYPGPFLANINPNNDASIAFWKSLGFKLKQVTYAK